MEKERLEESGFSAIRVSALAAVLLLIGALGFQIQAIFERNDASSSYRAPAPIARATGTPLAAFDTGALPAVRGTPSGAGQVSMSDAVLGDIVTKYALLKHEGLYTPEIGEKMAQNLVSSLSVPLSPTTYTTADIRTDPDTSYERMLTYRRDLQSSLKPLLENKRAEFEIFGGYVETKDPAYLDELRAAAENYRKAASSTARVVIPIDAVSHHIAILNALSQFASTLDALAQNANDPLGTVALLRSFERAESDVISSFRALVTYEKQKQS